MTGWTDHVKKVFKEGKSMNPEYQFKNALKDAGKTWDKVKGDITGGTPAPETPAPKKPSVPAAPKKAKGPDHSHVKGTNLLGFFGGKSRKSRKSRKHHK